MQTNKRKPDICTTYGHALVANHDCPSSNHRVCRWCYVDDKPIRVQARERGVKPNLNGPPDLGAVRFHERRAAAQAAEAKVAAIETPLPEIVVPKRRRKPASAAASKKTGWPKPKSPQDAPEAPG